MNSVNFNSFKSIKAPESLISRTLAAAQQPAKAPAPVVSLWRRRLVVAASILLVATVGISVYFYIRNINGHPLPVAPAPPATDVPTDDVVSPTVPGAFPTDPAFEASTAQPTEEPSVTPSAPASETPAVVPATQSPTVPPASPTEKTAPPTEPIAEVPTGTESTDNPEPQDPTDPPISPTVDPNPTDSEPGIPTPRQAIILGHFSTELLTGSGKVYCTLYSSSGASMGYDDPFSLLHLTETILINDSGIIWVRYRVPQAMTPFTDVYTAVFYNEDGETVCTTVKRITVDG